jgi:hypothetical protein
MNRQPDSGWLSWVWAAAAGISALGMLVVLIVFMIWRPGQ